MLDNTKKWLTFYLKSQYNENNHQLDCFTYCIDDTEKMLSQKILDTVAKVDYDTLFYIDVNNNKAKIFSENLTERWSDPYEVSLMDEQIQNYLREHYTENDKEQFLKDNTIPAIVEKMKSLDSYSVDYRIIENREVHFKRGNYCWIDKSKCYLCFTRTDITNAMAVEKSRAQELECKIKQAVEEERKLIAKTKDYFEQIREKDIMLTNLLENIPGGVAVYKMGKKSKRYIPVRVFRK